MDVQRHLDVLKEQKMDFIYYVDGHKSARA